MAEQKLLTIATDLLFWPATVIPWLAFVVACVLLYRTWADLKGGQ